MSNSHDSRSAIWDSFLQRWPMETLAQMTLAQYTQAGDKDSFCNWLESGTETLGSMWGGSAFKFGVYSRKDQTEKKDGGGLRYSKVHAWLTKYGESPEAAFEKVRSIIVALANAARVGNLEAIRDTDLGTVTKWKLAFLYQDQSQPCVLPIYKRESLQIVYGGAKANCATMQAALMQKRSGKDLFEYSDELLAKIKNVEAGKLTSKAALSALQDLDGLHAIKPATDKIAGFRTESGAELALVLGNKVPTLFVSPGSWLDVVSDQLEDRRDYKESDSRNSGLAANAPSLAEGMPAVSVKVPTMAALLAMCEAYDVDSSSAASYQLNPEVLSSSDALAPIAPLNQILFGPPGTGKTYNTINAALAVLDPALLKSHADKRDVLKARFDALEKDERIRFVTFHQSFSYEDFVEGIRAQSAPDGLHYSVESGVFKQLCEDAVGMSDVDKVIQQFLDVVSDTPLTLTTPIGKPFSVSYQDGNETVSCLPASTTTNKPLPANIDLVRQLLRGQTPKRIYCESYVLGIVNHLKATLNKLNGGVVLACGVAPETGR